MFSSKYMPPRWARGVTGPFRNIAAGHGDLGLVELSRRTGVDLATAADLDGLIAQLRAFQATRVH
jgi:hypothetical protein